MLTLVDLKVEIARTYKTLVLQDWKDKSHYRGITHRSQKDFDNLIPMYVKKISNIRESLRGNWSVTLSPITANSLKNPKKLAFELSEQLQQLLDKETRLIDKLAACCKEVQMRADGDVIRTTLHDQADYYIDYGQADDSGDGLTTGNAYKTITKYTITEVRTAGDRAFLRANVTWLQGTQAVDITFDEDGNQDDYIKIIGCDSVTNDPWSDSSDVLPIIDFEDASFQMKPNQANYWYFERLDFIRTGDSAGAIFILSSLHMYFKTCTVRNGLSTGTEGINVSVGTSVTLDNCTLQDTNGTSLNNAGAMVYCKDCTFDAGVVDGATYGIVASGGIVYCEDCSFDTNAFDSGTFRLNGGNIYLRNCSYQGAGVSASIFAGAKLYSEDDDETFESHRTENLAGTIARDTGTVRSGGADSSAKMTPRSTCGPNNPMVLGEPISGFTQLWLAAGSYTITVYVRVGSAWDTALTAAECYMVTSELDNAGNATRVKRQSAQQIANATTWTAFTTSISPAREGFVYIWLYLEEYEDASEHIFVDILPTAV